MKVRFPLGALYKLTRHTKFSACSQLSGFPDETLRAQKFVLPALNLEECAELVRHRSRKAASARTCRFDSCLLRLRFAVARQSVGELLQKLRRDEVRYELRLLS